MFITRDRHLHKKTKSHCRARIFSETDPEELAAQDR